VAKNLSKYREKRDPGRTNEPFSPEPVERAGGTLQGAFVVHQHDASRMHYDLRIQVGGVLKSFAVPRGPSLDPADKRMAVNTEDHPIEYLDFEAVIPEGNYGAGAMIVWDRGGVRYLEGTAEEGIGRGKIDFTLHGHKLRGRYALVKTSGRKGEPEPKQPQWLLLKKTDAYSRPDSAVIDEQARSVLSGLQVDELPRVDSIAAELEQRAAELGGPSPAPNPDRFIPMICATSGAKIGQQGMLYELKLDGVRILAARDGEDVRLRYRSLRDATASYPEVARAVRGLAPRRVVLDGEIVAFDEAGKPNFQRLGPRIQATRGNEARAAAARVPVAYVVFDILALGDRDLRGLPLLQRKELLAQVVRGKGLVRTLDHIIEGSEQLWAFCLDQELEGVVAKRADSKYRVGPERTDDWVKIKCDRDDDFVVIGYTGGKGGRGALGSLELASYRGERLVARGRVGSGLSGDSIDTLLAAMKPLETESCAAEGELMEAQTARTFVQPRLVVSVRYAGWTDAGHLRHPVFHGLRADAHASDCAAAPSDEQEQAELEQADRRLTSKPDATVRGRVHLTNQDKVFWPAQRFTKGDLCDFYDGIADTLLPYLADRPVLMVRYPDGIEGKSFYQWSVPQGLPDWIETFPLRSEEDDGRDVIAFLVNDRDTLLYMANLGAIPLHLLASRADDLEKADFLTLDFDIAEQPFAHAIELARTLHELLDELGLPSYPKTSGQTGLHVLVPMGSAPFATTKVLAELLGRIVLAKHPDLATMERMRARRPQAVYIDTGQTGRSRAIVAPYSVRARPGATVSTPLHWDEVGFGLDPGRFTIFSVPERLATIGDPMAPMLDARPDVATAVERIGGMLRSLK